MIYDIKNMLALLDEKTRRRLPISMLLSLVISGAEALGIGIILPFLLVLSDPSQVTKYILLSDAADWVGAESSDMVLLMLGLVMAGMFVTKNALMIFGTWWQTLFLAEGEAKLSIRLVKHYNHAPYLEMAGRNSAELIRNTTSVTNMVVSGYLLSLLSLVTELLIIIGISVVIFIADPRIAAGVGVFFLFAALALYLPMHQRLGKLGESNICKEFDVLRSLKEGLGSAKEIRVLNRERFFIDTFAKHRIALGRIRATQGFMNALGRPYLEIMMVLGVVLVAAVVLRGESKTEIIAALGLLGAAGLRVMPSVNRVLVLVQQIRSTMPAVGWVLEEFSGGAEQSFRQPVNSCTKIQGIHIQDIHFAYPDRTENALDAIDIDIPWGSSVGLVGSSGSGKSTLVDLVLGLMTPQSGGVFVDGKNIQEDLTSWRYRLGYVPQNIYLTDGTVRDNIALGVPNELQNGDRIAHAIRLAHLNDVIDDLPQGIDTLIGEDGVRLSGGQRQRVGIARALYHDPDVLIFDEATSALDNETEHQISQMIKEFGGFKTIIIIAHRLSTIRNCDKVVLINQGRKQAEGSFEELRKASTEFASLLSRGTL